MMVCWSLAGLQNWSPSVISYLKRAQKPTNWDQKTTLGWFIQQEDLMGYL